MIFFPIFPRIKKLSAGYTVYVILAESTIGSQNRQPGHKKGRILMGKSIF
jgi:hypothetical protein